MHFGKLVANRYPELKSELQLCTPVLAKVVPKISS